MNPVTFPTPDIPQVIQIHSSVDSLQSSNTFPDMLPNIGDLLLFFM